MSSDASSSSTSSTDTGSLSVIADSDQTHRLQNGWTFYYNTGTANDWKPKLFTTFSTVEDMWRLTNTVPEPARLSPGVMYYLFKETIKPEWEDPANKEGGRWILTIKVNTSPEGITAMNNSWLYTVLALCGEQFGQDNDDICGCVLKPRGKEVHIELWIRSDEDDDRIKRIGHTFKAHAEYFTTLQYKAHPKGDQDPKTVKKFQL